MNFPLENVFSLWLLGKAFLIIALDWSFNTFFNFSNMWIPTSDTRRCGAINHGQCFLFNFERITKKLLKVTKCQILTKCYKCGRIFLVTSSHGGKDIVKFLPQKNSWSYPTRIFSHKVIFRMLEIRDQYRTKLAML